METADWRCRVSEMIRKLADREYQERAWLGRDPSVMSSPAEMCCSLCDDLRFGEFLMTGDWTDEQTNAGRALVMAVEGCGVANDALAPSDVIDHPEWIRVRMSAQRLSKLL